MIFSFPFVVLLFPIPMKLKDGGSIRFQALLYNITIYHQLNHQVEKGYVDGIGIEILGLEILNTTDKVENTYACENTTDKVYLPSYKDYINPAYGFDSNATLSLSREAKTTDFARARGAWYNTKADHKYNGSYWTRSATSEYYYTAWNVNSGGYLSTYTVDDASHCVCPCITISI